MDIRKLQRAIVDGLEDVKGQNIVVFNTEHLSPLFERVIIASGTSNRQTKSLAASVRDSVKAAGMPPPRVEGEANGEWIIVDCGAAVVHVMQPSFRDYYHLEELWGEKPVRVKLGGASAVARGAAAKPAAHASETEKASGGDGERRSPARKASVSRAPAAKKAVTRSGGVKTPSREAGARTVGQKTARKPSRTSGKTTGAKAPPRRSTAAGGRSAPSKTAATRRAAPAKAAPTKKATPRTPARKR